MTSQTDRNATLVEAYQQAAASRTPDEIEFLNNQVELAKLHILSIANREFENNPDFIPYANKRDIVVEIMDLFSLPGVVAWGLVNHYQRMLSTCGIFDK